MGEKLSFAGDKHFDLADYLQNLPALPGIYRMLDKHGEVLYVGKAKHLKRRVSSYFSGKAQDAKTMRLVNHIARIEVTVVQSDYEAYILESNLIKEYRPRYNILLKDDKAYPYIAISSHPYPRVYGCRGRVNRRDSFFGPYVSLASMKQTLALIQKIFKVRQCTDSYFHNRSRPCLQYQIGRCTAPCVGYVSAEGYAAEVQDLKLFLKGHLNEVLEQVADKMQNASEQEYYELAATYRDQLVQLRQLQQQQYMNTASARNYEVFGVQCGYRYIGISMLQVWQGRVLGERSWVVALGEAVDDPAAVIRQLFVTYYLQQERQLWPHTIVVDQEYMPEEALQAHICHQAGRNIEFHSHPKGPRYQWRLMAQKNAAAQLRMKETGMGQYALKLTALEETLGLQQPLERFECFDISHLYGEQARAACVVFDRNGPCKSEYRQYSIDGITGGDDYAAMEQALRRRLRSGCDKGNLPGLLVIDGGRGQFNKAREVLEQMNLLEQVALVSLGKGAARQSGKEAVYTLSSYEPLELKENDPGFLLLRQIRDEAHRFSVSVQRQQSRKTRRNSVIETLPGIGARRTEALLRHFGGWQELERASREEIRKVPGIGAHYAEKIWTWLH